MKTYTLTVFDKQGQPLLDENFQGSHDKEAKQIAEQKLSEKHYSDHTHRCVSSVGKLLLFHP